MKGELKAERENRNEISKLVAFKTSIKVPFLTSQLCFIFFAVLPICTRWLNAIRAQKTHLFFNDTRWQTLDKPKNLRNFFHFLWTALAWVWKGLALRTRVAQAEKGVLKCWKARTLLKQLRVTKAMDVVKFSQGICEKISHKKIIQSDRNEK